MQEFLSEINYDKLIEKSLKNVVVEALKIAEDQGLPGRTIFILHSKPITPEPKFPPSSKTSIRKK